MKKSEALNTLGLAQGASEEDIKKAHRKLIIENHPDKFGQDEQARAKAEEKTKLINEARDVLLNHSWDPEYSTSGTPYGAPFSYNPSAGRPQNAPTAEELVQEAKADLRLDIELIVAKLVILALSFLLSAPATGLYLYTIISIGQGIWKRLNFLSLVLLVPFVMLALIFTPGGDATIGIIALILFACAVGFDVSNVYRHVKMIRTLKRG